MNKVFVGSLSWNVNEQELGDFFAQIGDIEEVKIITDRETGRSKGFGFITFVEEDSAQKSVDELDGKELDGRSIKVSIARDNEIPIKIFSILRNNCFKNVYNNKQQYSEINNV